MIKSLRSETLLSLTSWISLALNIIRFSLNQAPNNPPMQEMKTEPAVKNKSFKIFGPKPEKAMLTPTITHIMLDTHNPQRQDFEGQKNPKIKATII